MSDAVVGDIPGALRAFFEVQTRRAQLYSRFQNGFKSFLQTKQEGTYQALMAELTAAFSGCSREVMALEAALKELGRPDLAGMLREVQASEREKLRLTLTLQALRQTAAFRTLSWQQRSSDGVSGGADVYGDAGGDADDDEALALLDPHFAASRRHSHCCAHGHGHAHGDAHAHAHGHGHGAECGHGHGLEDKQEQHGVEAVANGHGHGAEQQAPASGTGDGREVNGDVGDATESGGGSGCRAEAAVGGVAAAASGGSGGERLQAEEPGCGQRQGAGGGHGHAHAGGCGGGPAAGGAPAEPTRQEFEAAVKEATQELDRHIRKINDMIGDLRMELEDE